MNKFIDNIKNIGILIGVLILFLIGPTVFRELINLTGLKNEVLVSLLSSVIVALLIGLIFYKNLVNDFKDFKKKTEEEVAAIRGVGKVSMKILKENGVVYKKKRKKK